MKITLLGTGSPEPHARRASSGYLVETGTETLLLDCGGGVFDRLIQSGRKPSDVDKIFFSHLHSDHMMDYARLVHANWDERGKDYDVFGPPPIDKITGKLFGRDGVFATDLTARTENEGSKAVWLARGGTLPRPWPAPKVTNVMPGFSASGDGWILQSCEVPHAQPYLDCMAFRIETPSGVFVYSGDAGPCAELEQLSQGADVLVHWCYRLAHETASAYIAARSPAPADIAAIAQRAGVKTLVVTYFSSAYGCARCARKGAGGNEQCFFWTVRDCRRPYGVRHIKFFMGKHGISKCHPFIQQAGPGQHLHRVAYGSCGSEIFRTCYCRQPRFGRLGSIEDCLNYRDGKQHQTLSAADMEGG